MCGDSVGDLIERAPSSSIAIASQLRNIPRTNGNPPTPGPFSEPGGRGFESLLRYLKNALGASAPGAFLFGRALGGVREAGELGVFESAVPRLMGLWTALLNAA